MQRNKHRLMVVAISLGALFNMSSLAASAQDADDRIAAAFALIEFDGTADRADVRKALSALTQKDIAKLCEMLVEPGTGDDTKPRMTLHAIALATVAGVDAQHARFTAALGAALKSDAPLSVKGFLVRQLQLAGDGAAVPHLAALANDDDLCGQAVRALLAIGGADARRAVSNALTGSRGVNRVVIINALGRLHDDMWVPTLIDDAAGSDEVVRDAALNALAQSGRPEATDAILSAYATARRSHSWTMRSRRTADLLRFGSRLAEEGHASPAAQVFRVIMDAYDDPAHERSAALRGLANALGVRAVNAVVNALTSKDAQYRAAAMHVAVDLKGARVTAAYVDLLSDAPAAVTKTILEVLALRGDDSALPAALNAFGHADKAVRLAAVRTATKLGRERALDALVTFVDTEQRDELAAGVAALASISGSEVSRRIALAVSKAPPRARAALLSVLARRAAREELSTVLDQTEHSDQAVRIAAIDAAGKLGGIGAAPRLLELLTRVAAAGERSALESALAAACNRADDLAARAAPVLRSLDPKQTETYGSLLRILGRVGGDDAFAAVRKATGDSRADIQTAAYRALTDWPQAAVADDVLKLARDAKQIRHHVFAMRAYARLVGLNSSRSSDDSLAMYRAGLDATRRADEKKMMLSKIGDLETENALTALQPFLSDDDLSSEAASAMITAANGLLPAGWQAARDAIEKILATSPPDAIRSRADALQERVAEFEDYITDWLTAGPYSKQGKKGNEILDTVFAPEQSGAADIKWVKQPVTEDPGRYWFIDMTRVFNGPNRVGYLYTRIHSAKDQPIRLELGSDDGLKVWLNGENIHTNNALRGCQRAQDIVKATLKKGMNELLLKVSNNGGGWAACVRVRAPDGGRLTDVSAKADGPPE